VVPLGEVERRMRPGGWFTRPLLLSQHRLEPILEADARALAEMNVTAQALGAALGNLLRQASGSDWHDPYRHSRLDVEVRHRRGFITCPWAEDETEKCVVGEGVRPTANEFLIRHRSSGATIAGFEISAHLVRDHGFFGGPGTVFRIEPTELASLLEFATDKRTKG
jgi:hypothetical protein